MATKKQKRLAGQAKHEQYMEELRQSGLAAQRRDKAERFRQQLNLWEEGHNKRHHKFVDECPHCQIIKSAISRGASLQAAKKEVDEIRASRQDIPPTIDLSGVSLPASDSVDVVFSHADVPEDASSLEMECI